MPRALISVSDKRGIVEFARELVGLGWEIVSTGGTAASLRKAGVPVMTVEQVTKFPEILDGRVKTLHPAIHAGLLARPDIPGHMRELDTHQIARFQLVAVNLYPFRATIAEPSATLEDAIENIDIGGPSILRGAAKNYQHVIPIVDPTDYHWVLVELRKGDLPEDCRRGLAAKVFGHTAEYDTAVAGYLTVPEEGLPPRINLSVERMQELRYGENPTQRAALYATEEPRGIRDMKQRHGREISFNNLLDIDAAAAAVAAWTNRPACAIIKHTTPCGIAVGRTALEALTRARATDPVSAFGGVVACNTVIDREMAESLRDLFVEVVVAPSVADDALVVFREKKNLRVIELPIGVPAGSLDWKSVRGGFLVQDRFTFNPSEEGWNVATTRIPTPEEWNDLRFAWAAVGIHQVQRHHPGQGRAVHRDRRRPDEPGGRGLPRNPQGAAAAASHRGNQSRLRRILSLPRWRRRSGPGRGRARSSSRVGRFVTPRWWRPPIAPGIAMVMTGRRMFRH